MLPLVWALTPLQKFPIDFQFFQMQVPFAKWSGLALPRFTPHIIVTYAWVLCLLKIYLFYFDNVFVFAASFDPREGAFWPQWGDFLRVWRHLQEVYWLNTMLCFSMFHNNFVPNRSDPSQTGASCPTCHLHALSTLKSNSNFAIINRYESSLCKKNSPRKVCRWTWFYYMLLWSCTTHIIRFSIH